MKRVLITTATLLALLYTDPTFCADRAASEADLQKVQERIRDFEKDVAVLSSSTSTRLDAQDKRIGDLGVAATQQGTIASSIANYISWTGIGITLLVAIGSIFTYFGAKSRAVKEAQSASRQWFEDNRGTLQREIDGLRRQAKEVADQMVAHESAVRLQRVKVQKEMDAVADLCLNFTHNGGEILSQLPAVRHVREVSDTLRDKPESQFTAVDHYSRGVSHLTTGNYQSALGSFESAIQRLDDETPESTSQLARLLFMKAGTLVRMGKDAEAVNSYDQLFQKFEGDARGQVHEWVAKGLVNAAGVLGRMGKVAEELSLYDTVEARFGQSQDPTVRAVVASALANKAIALSTDGRSDESLATYRDLKSRFGSDPSPGVREEVARALVDKAVLVSQRGTPDQERTVYDEIDQLFADGDSPGVRQHVVRGLFSRALFMASQGLHDDGNAIYERIRQRFLSDTDTNVRHALVSGFLNQAITLERSDQLVDAMRLCEELERRFASDTSEAVQTQTMRVRNCAAFVQILLAKQGWHEVAVRKQCLDKAFALLTRTRQEVSGKTLCMVLGNLSYCSFLRGNHAAAHDALRECQQIADHEIREGLLDDAKRHRVDDVDAAYERLVAEVFGA